MEATNTAGIGHNQIECTCERCVALCKKNPGWFTPEEAKAAIEAGHAKSMMLDYYVSDPNIWILSPAVVGREAYRAPNTEECFGGASLFAVMFSAAGTKGRCVFLGTDDRCQIYEQSFRPRQCRECFGCKPVGPDNHVMMALWNTPAGQALVNEWMEIVDFDRDLLEECH